MNLFILFERPSLTMDTVLASIFDRGQANHGKHEQLWTSINSSVFLSIYIKPRISALARPLLNRLPASNREYPQISRRRRGKQHHHGDDVCGIDVVGLKGFFALFLLQESYGVGVFCCSRPNPNRGIWPNKSHDVTIETPTNHSSSHQDMVFRSVENNVGIIMQLVISKKARVFKSH